VGQNGDDLSIRGAKPFRDAALPRCERDRRKGPEIDLTGALEITLVIELLNGWVGRIAIREVVRKLERANPRLDPLRKLLLHLAFHRRSHVHLQ
jgi:hypothetical protein